MIGLGLLDRIGTHQQSYFHRSLILKLLNDKHHAKLQRCAESLYTRNLGSIRSLY